MGSASLRHRFAGVFPAFVREPALRAWRKLYWWNARRVPPSRGRKAAERILATGQPIKLEIGSGPRLAGWTSLDLNVSADIQHDLTRPLPFPYGSVDEIYSSHVLEHFTYPRPLLGVLEECHRILKPGGRIRIAVPNARIFLQAYFEPDGFDREKFCNEPVGLKFQSRIDVVNFIAYLGGDHKFMFDSENLPLVIAEAGFRDVRLREFDPSIDVDYRRHESIYAEALK
jgi:predicted SAM-dependent methyltransferase